MAQDNKIHMPGVFGGLMRYDDEFVSKFMLSPSTIVGFIVAIILLAVGLRVFSPFAG